MAPLAMKRRRLAVAVLCASLACGARAADAPPPPVPLDYGAFAGLPVLEQGRVKSLETFARSRLLVLAGQQSADGLAAVEWLAETLFDPERAHRRRVFQVRGNDTLDALSLARRAGHLYSFDEVSQATGGIADTIETLHRKPPQERTPLQGRLVEISLRVLWYAELSRALSLLLPDYVLRSEAVARELRLAPGVAHTYLELLRVGTLVAGRAGPLLEASQAGAELAPAENELLVLAHRLSQVEKHGRNRIFPGVLRVIPPQWGDNEERWFAPWELVMGGHGSPASAALFESWTGLAHAWRARDAAAWAAVSTRLRDETVAAAGLSPVRLALEVLYSRLQPFDWSFGLYLLALLALAASYFGRGPPLRATAAALLAAGALAHFAGIAVRVYVLLRPPVATLYESIIFVGLVAVVFGLLLERARRNGNGILIGAVLGAALHLVGRGYADEGDTMEMLVAVLNTNFWLATHVLMMTVGYGCSLVGGVCGHVYLVRRVLAPDAVKLRELHANMIGITLCAAFFAMFGTILGGIWADQSWGRFWGWDPKENGALLIVLWLFLLLHGHLSRTIGALGYALGMVFTNIVVALAWFGVNLLNVGLHSYGFTDNIALNLALFCGAELLFGVLFYALARRRARNGEAASAVAPPA